MKEEARNKTIKELQDLMGEKHNEVSKLYYEIDCIKTVLVMLKPIKETNKP